MGYQELSKRGVQSESKSYSLGTTFSLGGNAGSIGLNFGWAKWRWKFDQMTAGRAWGYLYQSPRSPVVSPVVTQNPLLAMVMRETGPWHFATPGAPGEDLSGKGGELYVRHAADKLEYLAWDSLSFPSQDIYNVMGQGLTGSFKPFVRRAMTVHAAYTDMYDGLIGRIASPQATTIDEFFNYGGPQDTLRISEDYRDGIVFKMVSEASLNFVDSLTNCTYTNSYANGLYDWNSFQPIDDRDYRAGATRIDPIFGLDQQLSDKLCGFVVTDKQGKTYWYTEPLFSLQDASYICKDGIQPTQANKADCTLREDFGAAARTWLLTAITGPDYVKRALDADFAHDTIRSVDDPLFVERLMPHNADWGFWVRFRYSYGMPVTDHATGMPRLNTRDLAY